MSTKLSKDERIIKLLASTLEKLNDFKGHAEEAKLYAASVVAAVRAHAADVDEFKDQVMGIVANVSHLDGELRAGGIEPAKLATMAIPEILSHAQKKEQKVISRKRAREQTDYDKTSLLCKKCGLVRGDRLNINELALDSEENGSHFDYNFDNVCNCSRSNSSSSNDEEDEEDEEKEAASKSSTSSVPEKGQLHDVRADGGSDNNSSPPA